MQSEITSLKEYTIKNLQTEVKEIKKEVINSNTRLDKMDNSITSGFARMEALFFNSPQIPPRHDNSASSQPTDDSIEIDQVNPPSSTPIRGMIRKDYLRPDGQPEKKKNSSLPINR